MPIHDWSKVDANVYHHFHQSWSLEICRALNDGLLPPGYSALVEQRAAGLSPDVLTVERRGPRTKSAGGALVAERPATMFVYDRPNTSRGSSISIRHRMGDVVCMLEIVSSGNKSSKAALRAFVSKTVEFLRNGVNVLAVDLFPPSTRDPGGIHNAIWTALGGEEFDFAPETPLTLAAYNAAAKFSSRNTRAYVEPVAVGQSLPDMPAFLVHDQWIPVPLEATYQAAWKTCPADMRFLVENGRLPDE